MNQSHSAPKLGPRERRARGLDREQVLAEILVSQGFEILTRDYAPGLRGSGFGRFDVVARRGRELWLLEVKAHAPSTSYPLLSAHQRVRLMATHSWVRARYPQYTVRWALVWIHPTAPRILDWIESP